MTREEVKKRLLDVGYSETSAVLTTTNKDGSRFTIVMYDTFFLVMEEGKPERYLTLYDCLGKDENDIVSKIRQETKEELDYMIRRVKE